MSIWTEISAVVARLANDAFSSLVETVRTVFEGDVATRRNVSFSIAMIALSAKMAKADGIVTGDEVRAFQHIFEVPDEELKNVARLYNIAKADVAGFESYAAQVKSMFADNPDVLHDVIDGLFHIAKADDVLHERELVFLEEVSRLFGFSEREFDWVCLRHLHPEDGDPYLILGAQPDWSYAELKKQYRKRVSENHPDRLMARGVPAEFVAIANERLARINGAWDRIETLRAHARRLEKAV